MRGHDEIKANLSILITAAKRRGAPLPHLLFSGPPGLGKTTLALVTGAEMGTPVLQLGGDSAPVAMMREILLSRLTPGTVLFIDEIHRLNGPVVELLYRPMEDGIALIDGNETRLPPFTLVGATTNPGRISGPMRQRFRERFHVDFLDIGALATTAWFAAESYGIGLSKTACVEIAKRAKGTPRRVVRFVAWIADCTLAMKNGHGEKTLGVADVDRALLRLRIGREGFDPTDRRYLSALSDQFAGGPVGVKALAAALSEEQDTVEREIEPWLVSQGYVQLTAKGRALGPGPG